MIEIPDGDRAPIYFMQGKIVAIRQNHNDPKKSYIWLADGNDDPWVVECPIDHLKTIIPLDQQ